MNRRSRSQSLLGNLASVLGICWLALASLAGPRLQAQPAPTYQNPIIPGNLADPAVIRHDGVYYLYATGEVNGDNGTRVYTSTNLVDWQRGPVVFQPGQPHVWAPDVWRDPASGRFYLYYTVNQTVGVAEGDGPLGPFRMVRKFFDRAIDAHLFRDDDGKLYLYYVQLPGFRISVQPMANPTELSDKPRVILQPESEWEKRAGHVTEGPWMIKHRGRYYLLYSGSGADTPDYAVGYATADSPLGPFIRAAHNPIVQRSEGLFGPGHGCAIQDTKGQWWHVYHQKRNNRVEWNRFISLDPLWFDQDGKLHSRATRGTRETAPGATTTPPARAPLAPGEIHVSPTGNDAHPGTAEQPLATLAAAQRAVRPLAGRVPVTVWLHKGTHYLAKTVQFTAEDSGSASAPVVYAAARNEQAVLSGGTKLDLDWQPHREGILQAKTPAGLVMDQLFVNGQRLHGARYPNYDPNARQFNGSAADAIARERVARWNDPAGGYIHAMHTALWGDMHWRILGKKPDGSLDYEGGWQNNRPSAMHKQFRFVENIREELDAPGEWFHDSRNGTLYLWPPAGVNLNTATVEVVRLRHLIEFNGTQEKPVKFITLRGLTFRHAARTFMENREPLLRSDWTTYRGGTVVFNGAEDAAIEDCDFDQLGGNTIFVNNYNRRIAVRGCLLRESGANGIAFIGDPKAVRSPLFNYGAKFDYAKLDRAPGPIGDNFPADCLVEDCLITRSGRFEKQTAPVQISMAQGITVRHCSIYDVPRAGINIGDGCWGGHVIEHCDIFDTVLETGDHGSFNSWGRDRYWHPDVRIVDKQVAADPALPFLDMLKPTTLRHNRWRCDHGWDIDLDDGSSRYVIHDNLLLRGGLKLREGYARIATNNVIVGNSLHPHVWFENSGDVFARNIVMGPYRPAIMNVARWGSEVDHNLFATTEADRTKFADKGCDLNSLVGDPLFVDAAKGDFRVRDGSPALKLGFVNFPMDQFGVRSPRLRALARTPEIPAVKITASGSSPTAAETAPWQGATLRELLHYEFSALGVAADAGGVLAAEVARDTPAFNAGLRRGDFIQRVNGQAVRDLKAFLAGASGTAPGGKLKLDLIRNQQPQSLEMNVPGPR